jgi:hypothetical protein
MIEISTVTALLAAEALAAMFATLVVLALRALLRNRREDQHASVLVERLAHVPDPHAAGLANDQAPCANWSETEAKALAEAIGKREQALYHCVIEAFVKRDAEILDQLDEHVHGLSEPYCQALKAVLARAQEAGQSDLDRTPASPNQNLAGENEALRQQVGNLGQACEQMREQIRELSATGEQLRRELQAALTQLEEVSGEYARVFHEKGEGELEASRQKMLERFRLAAGLLDDSAGANGGGST